MTDPLMGKEIRLKNRRVWVGLADPDRYGKYSVLVACRRLPDEKERAEGQRVVHTKE